MKETFMGIDISTTASKALIIDKSGAVIASHSVSHPLSTPHPLWSEQNPYDWWDSFKKAVCEVLKQVSKDEIKAIGLTGQMHGLVTLDKQGQVLRPAILWNDGRSFKECEEITDLLGKEFLINHIGSMLLPCFIAPKLMWLKKNEPEVFSQIAHVLLPKDYMGFRLSGEFATDVSDGSGLGLMEIAKRDWSDTILSALEIPKRWLPSLYESQEICGYVSAFASKELGLKEGTPIVAGAGDQPAGGIGSGITEPHVVSIAVGTSGVTFSINDRFQPEVHGKLNTFCHAIPGKWFHMGVSMSAAGSLRWLRDGLTKELSYQSLDAMAAEIPRGAKGLLFAPYLSGERHPHSDAHVRGSFVGLTLRHDLRHMVKAVLEGVAFSLRDNLELMRSLGVNPRSIILSGGAANSQLWRSIIGETLGLPLQTLQANEGAALGAAILASVGIGAWRDISTACKDLIQKNKEEHPDTDGIKAYNALYPIYQELYPNLSGTSHKLSQYEDRS